MYKKAKSKDKYCGVKKNSNLYVACFMGWQFEKKLTWPQKSQRCNLSFFFLFFFLPLIREYLMKDVYNQPNYFVLFQYVIQVHV